MRAQNGEDGRRLRPEGTRVSGHDDTPKDVHAVLAQIGAEEAIARLESRIQTLELDLERVVAGQRDAATSHRGELDVMRARVEDATALVRETLEEQRNAWLALEDRVARKLTQAQERGVALASELRDDLVPRVQATIARVDDLQAALDAGVEAVTADLRRHAADLAQRLGQHRSAVDDLVTGVREAIAQEEAARAGAIIGLERQVAQTAAASERALAARFADGVERTEALRRELDASAGELRAALRFEVGQVADALASVHDDLAQAIGAQAAELADTERRWLVTVDGLVRRIDAQDRGVREALAGERARVGRAIAELAERVDVAIQGVERLDARVATDGDRRAVDDEQLRHVLDELRARADRMEDVVTTSLAPAAAQVRDRLRVIEDRLDGLSETQARHRERLTVVDRTERRLEELEGAQATLRDGLAAAPAPTGEASGDRASDTLAALRREVAELVQTTRALTERVRDLDGRLDAAEVASGGAEPLRLEVRDLAARTAELGQRLEETERLARAAGNAIASVLRRQQQRRTIAADTAAEDPPPLFPDRQRVVLLPQDADHDIGPRDAGSGASSATAPSGVGAPEPPGGVRGSRSS